MRDRPMTLIVALAGRNEIVIGADGISHDGDLEGQYVTDSHKLRHVLRDKWVAGIAGTTAGYTLLSKASAEKQNDLFGLSDRLALIYKRDYCVDLRLVFAGFEHDCPALYTWNGVGGDVNGLILAEKGRVVTGLDKHGALHFVHAYHSTDMDVNQLALLCHYCLSEATRQDTRLGNPISMAVISRDAITDLDEGQIKKLRDASTRMRKNIGKLFTSNAPMIYDSSSAIDQT